MKKITFLILIAFLSFSVLSFGATADAASRTHSVRSGDTYWKIAARYGVTVSALKQANGATSDMIRIGQVLVVPNSVISDSDKDLMARLVSAEAKGESYAGKVAVASVILNRVNNPNFPNTVREVIYQVDNGYYAFTPVQNGAINQPADSDSKRAVNEALALNGQGKGSLYFYNPNTARSSWILSREVTVTIGNHRFAK